MTTALPFTLDAVSGLVSVDVRTTPAELETRLNAEGFTGDFDTRALTEPFLHYLTTPSTLMPYSKRGDLTERAASLTVRLPDGREARTLLTPRSAAGPDLRALLLGTPDIAATIVGLTLRVHEKPAHRERRAVLAPDVAAALRVLRGEIQAKNRPSVFRVYDRSQLAPLLPNAPADSALIVAGYDGERADAELRLGRLAKALLALPGSEEPAAASPLCKDDFAPLYLGTPPKAAALHAAVIWSRLKDVWQALAAQKAALTLSGAWHHAALLSLSLDGGASASAAALAVLTQAEAALLDVAPALTPAPTAATSLDALTERWVRTP